MFKSIEDCKVKDRVVFLRADLNVPIKNGEILDDTRIRATIPTIIYLTENGAKVVLASHLGKASGKGFEKEFSLEIVLERLRQLLPTLKFYYSRDCIGPGAKKIIEDAPWGSVVLLENLRFHREEEENGEAFARELAGLADIYVNDAFSTCHRKHASMVGIPALLESYGGINLIYELDNLTRLVSNPKRPLAVIVGGSKISTKLELLRALVRKSDYLVVGGGIANTFLFAQGVEVGASLREEELRGEALALVAEAERSNCRVLLPVDVVVTDRVTENPRTEVKDTRNLASHDIIADFGPRTLSLVENSLGLCKTIIWNGPLGIYEISPFDRGTNSIAKFIAAETSQGRVESVAGGGDILAALAKASVYDKFTYLTTAGGAFLQWLERGILPAIEKLKS
ncbi:MAG: phosphoglycerate kinase [Rickettsiales bacterium]|jgi:phosphoglycerate kinase|nr:phosphoglycerate kinase [Rickettsiales bacterium]